jgi:hypothetical protein
MRSNIGVTVCLLALTATAARADLNNPDTDWMSARYGVGFHYLQNWLAETKDGGPAEWNATVDSFDVNRFASDVAATGAKWVLFTVGQNSGYYAAPCAVMNSYSGYAPGERCSRRDLPMDMANALQARGIRLVLYLPVNAPKEDARIANGFGLTVKDGSNGNWHMNTAFVQKWTQVVKEWSDRYGARVSGWWFDGAYGANGWTSSWGAYYKNAAVSGNADSIIALNGGAGSLSKRSDSQDYTAGEDGDLSTVCSSRWFSGLHCATFIPFGSWGGAGAVKWTDAQVVDYTNRQRGVGATVTWNLGVSGAGVVNPSYAAVLIRIKGSIGGGTGPTPTPSPTPTPVPGGGLAGHYKMIARHSGKAVVVQGASTANAANVFQWTYGGANTNDEWLFSSLGGGYYQILNRNSGKALAVQSASTATGANVFQWAYGGAVTNDEWQPVDLGNGYYRIANRNSGKVLNVAGASTGDGANVDQWGWANVNQQMFQIVAVP